MGFAMPELPDVDVYVIRLRERILGKPFERIVVKSPFLVRTVTPAPSAILGREVESVTRRGKRIVIGGRGGPIMAIHLMVAGRFQWKPHGTLPKTKMDLAAFTFPSGTLLLTEASTKKRASIHMAENEAALDALLGPTSLEPLRATAEQFREAMRRENRTLKRALTDPRILSGIGNSYSDEILHAAMLSPATRTASLDDAAFETLRLAIVNTLTTWRERLEKASANEFPKKVTAFHPEMAVHGKFGKPCPRCGSPVQRIVYAENESNYCPRCQTGGKLLADRAFSRLLGSDWPKTLEALEERMGRAKLDG